MADLKHTAAEVDAAIYRVERGSVVTENTDREISPDGIKPVAGGAVYEALQGKVDKVEGKGLSTNDYTDEEKMQLAMNTSNIAEQSRLISRHGTTLTEHAEAIAKNAEEIERKQPQLSVTIKDNGNIVISNLDGGAKEFMPATPSGDPRHYVYLKNPYVKYDNTTGLWSYMGNYGGLTDITTAEMSNMYDATGGYNNKEHGYSMWANKVNSVFPARMNICSIYYGDGQGAGRKSNWSYAFFNNQNIEIAVVIYGNPSSESNSLQANIMSGVFSRCGKLRRVIGYITMEYIQDVTSSVRQMFSYSPLLEDVRILKLKGDISFSDCPLLNKDSILCAITKATPSKSITITLHADAYARLSADSDIQAALAAQPLVTLISAE